MKKPTSLLLTFSLLVALITTAQAQTLVSVTSRGTLPKFLADFALGQFGLTARGDIDYFDVAYTMENFAGGIDTVSGLMVRPSESGFRFPVAIYQHGTTLTKFAVPTNATPGQDLPYLIATQGYVTLAPDFLNMGDDPDGFHPYVHKRSEALAALRMKQALETLPEYAAIVTDQLFLTGYSQGGHASMALHELLIEEYPNIPVTAAAHMSGPYSVSEIMKDSVILNERVFPYVAFLPYTVLGYQAVYPELDEEISEIFRPQYVPIITAFRDGYAQGRIGLDSLTRSILRSYTIAEGNTNYYPSRLLLPEFAAALRDPNNAYVQRLRENDTYRFVNPTPTRLLYCRADDQVYFRNSLVAQDSLRAYGATATEAIDVQSNANHSGCVVPAVSNAMRFFATFQRIVSGVSIPMADSWEWRQHGRELQVITHDDAANYRMLLVDAAGRTLIDQSYRSGDLASLASVPSGFAVVRLIDEQGRVAGKSVVVR